MGSEEQIKVLMLALITWLVSPVVNIHLKFKTDWYCIYLACPSIIGTIAFHVPSCRSQPSSQKPFLTILFNTIHHILFSPKFVLALFNSQHNSSLIFDIYLQYRM